MVKNEKTISFQVQKFASGSRTMVEYLTHYHYIKGFNPSVSTRREKRKKMKQIRRSWPVAAEQWLDI
jgi:hypothetical protein